jgi:hypothetical protein
MRLVFRRFKNYFIILILVLIFSYMLINYVNLKKKLKDIDKKLAELDSAEAANRKNEQKQQQEGKEEKKPDPVVVKEEEVVKRPPRPGVTDKQLINPIDTDEKSDKKSAVVNASSSVENNNTTKRTRFYAMDGNGRGSVNRELVKCSSELEVEIISSDFEKADFTYFFDSVPSRTNIDAITKGKKRHYYMVYAMESEPHSGGGETWHNADFIMWYNLDLSFPEPATYFDVKSYLPDLLAGPRVEFEQKETSADLVWVLSNCNAHNSREKYVKKLMDLVKVDSYGFCLRNKDTHTSQRMSGNVELFSKYKFVITIENSNCEDYVTEKLVHAVASGSIPIVAGRDGKPDYARYLPKNSYINIYDFKSVEDLVAHLKKVASSKEEYEKYIHFKRKHNYTREYLAKLPLNQMIDVAKSVLGQEQEREFFNGLVMKEKSENKICKIARYLQQTPADVIEAEAKKHKRNRPSVGEACLPHGVFVSDFKL